MEIFEQFTDDKGVSQIKPMPDEIMQKLTGWAPAKAWRLNIMKPGTFLDWHPAAGKLLSIVLSGEFEIGTSDGNTFLCKPGTLRVVTDTGKGHTARVVGDNPCMLLMVEIAE